MSTQHLVFNNLGSTLTNAITAGQTSFDVDDPVFTDPGTDFYTITAENVSTGSIEIMKVIGVTGSTLTVERGFESTSPAAFDAGNPVQVRTTAGLISRLGQKSDLGTQYPFQTTVVTGLLNLYVDPAGSDATGDGSVGNPWATPYKAVEELQFIRFGVTGSAVVNFAAGTYSMDAQLVCNHPQGYRISFTSAATFQPITGMPIADYSSNRNSPTVPGRGATEFHNTAGTVGANASDSTRATNRANDWANNLTLLKSLNGCVFEWASAGADESKVHVITSLGGLSNICLVFPTPSPGVTDVRYGIHVAPGATLQASELELYGSQIAVYINEGQVRCDSVAISGARAGIQVENAGVLDTGGLNIQGGDRTGLTILSNAVLDLRGNCTSSGHNGYGASIADGSTLRTGSFTFTYTGNWIDGLLLTDNASIVSTGTGQTNCTGNRLVGAQVLRGAAATLNGISCEGNGNTGFVASVSGAVKSNSGTQVFRNNGGVGLNVSEGAYLGATSVTLEDNSATGLFVESGGSVEITTTTIQRNTRAVFVEYAGPSVLTNLTVDTTNTTSPQMLAQGGSIVKCPAPGAGGVAGDVVFSPLHNVLGATGQIFTDE